MRVFLSIICPTILSAVVFTDIDLAPSFMGSEVTLAQVTEHEAQSFAQLAKKKKRLKNSKKVKKHNRSMGKGFRRKNDDTLRRE